MAGDRGMRYPELTGAALQHLDTTGCTDGYSSSRTCEMSLSNHSGINFRGLVRCLPMIVLFLRMHSFRLHPFPSRLSFIGPHPFCRAHRMHGVVVVVCRHNCCSCASILTMSGTLHRRCTWLTPRQAPRRRAAVQLSCPTCRPARSTTDAPMSRPRQRLAGWRPCHARSTDDAASGCRIARVAGRVCRQGGAPRQVGVECGGMVLVLDQREGPPIGFLVCGLIWAGEWVRVWVVLGLGVSQDGGVLKGEKICNTHPSYRIATRH